MECKYTLATWHKHWAQRMHVVCVCALSQQCVFLRIQNKSLHKFYVLFFHQFYFIFGYNRVVRRFLYVSRDSLFVAIWFFSFTSFDCAQFLSLKWLNNAFCGSQEHKCMQQSEKRARETKRIAIKSIVVFVCLQSYFQQCCVQCCQRNWNIMNGSICIAHKSIQRNVKKSDSNRCVRRFSHSYFHLYARVVFSKQDEDKINKCVRTDRDTVISPLLVVPVYFTFLVSTLTVLLISMQFFLWNICILKKLSICYSFLWQLFFACLLLLYCSRACVYARKESFAVVLVSRLTNSTAFLRNGSFFLFFFHLFRVFFSLSFRVWRALHFSMAITQTSMTTVWPLQIKIGKRERKKARNE